MTLDDLQIGAGHDIWGIDSELCITVGYDSGAPQANAGYRDEDEEGEAQRPLPLAEKLRLADKMIDRWARYRAAILAKDCEACPKCRRTAWNVTIVGTAENHSPWQDEDGTWYNGPHRQKTTHRCEGCGWSYRTLRMRGKPAGAEADPL